MKCIIHRSKDSPQRNRKCKTLSDLLSPISDKYESVQSLCLRIDCSDLCNEGPFQNTALVSKKGELPTNWKHFVP